jgi:hypothetical protein
VLLAAFIESAQYIAADAAITVDCNFDRHVVLLIEKKEVVGAATPARTRQLL